MVASFVNIGKCDDSKKDVFPPLTGRKSMIFTASPMLPIAFNAI